MCQHFRQNMEPPRKHHASPFQRRQGRVLCESASWGQRPCEAEGGPVVGAFDLLGVTSPGAATRGTSLSTARKAPTLAELERPRLPNMQQSSPGWQRRSPASASEASFNHRGSDHVNEELELPLVRRLDYYLMTGCTGYSARENTLSRGEELDPHVRAVEMRKERERRLLIQHEQQLRANPLRYAARSLFSSLGGRRSSPAGQSKLSAAHGRQLSPHPLSANGAVNGAHRRSHDSSDHKHNGFTHLRHGDHPNGLSAKGRQRAMNVVSDIANGHGHAAIFRPPSYQDALTRYESDQQEEERQRLSNGKGPRRGSGRQSKNKHAVNGSAGGHTLLRDGPPEKQQQQQNHHQQQWRQESGGTYDRGSSPGATRPTRPVRRGK